MVVSFSEYGGPNMSIVDEMGKLGVPSMVVTEADIHGEGMPSGSEGVTGKRLGNTIGEVGGVNTRGSFRTESDIGTKADGAGDEDNPESTDERRPMNSAGGSAVVDDTGSPPRPTTTINLRPRKWTARGIWQAGLERRWFPTASRGCPKAKMGEEPGGHTVLPRDMSCPG